MDLSFQPEFRRQDATAVRFGQETAIDLSLLLAIAAARQAASPTARYVAMAGVGGEEDGDMVRALTTLFAPKGHERRGDTMLSGSFHPLIYRRLEARREGE